jgi:S1-C subfamily serine protease
MPGIKELRMVKRSLSGILSLIFLVASVAIAQSPPPRKDIPAIAKAADGAIVSIIMSRNGSPIAQGSGFFVSKDGIVVTNYHVIASGDSAVVKFPDGNIFPVDGILAANKVRDLAVIKTHGRAFKVLTLWKF